MERAKLGAEVKKREAVLIEKGEKVEVQQNKNIVERFCHWSLSTFGVLGVVALCAFCPAAIPIVARIAGWLVSKIPALTGVMGVVGRKAFDAVVVGVGVSGGGKTEKIRRFDFIFILLAPPIKNRHA